MPIYEYVCQKCKVRYETLYLTFSAVERDEKTEKCPECGSKHKKRAVSKSTGFSLKGKWFKDGY